MFNKNAFTLTELLVAMAIIGAVAAMSIPSMMNNINKAVSTAQLKGFVQSVKQAANDQLLVKRTSILDNTDFSTPRTLLENNFDASRICTYEQTECWPNLTYKTLSGGTYNVTRQTTALLKNGATILYNLSSYYDSDNNKGDLYAEFYIDLNGAKKPNIVGRDLFQFYISKRGKIYANTNLQALGDHTDEDTGEVFRALHLYRDNCLNGQPESCFGAIMMNGWRMSY